jgi:hypothetical protein
MNRFSKFFHELFNPHCQHCKLEAIEQARLQHELREMEIQHSREQQELDRTCDSCESLKLMNAQLLQMNADLVSRIGNPPVEKTVVQEDRELKPIRPAYIPPSVRRNMMEKEDRAKARAMRDAAAPDPVPTNTAVVGAIDHKAELADIEKELEDVSGTEEKTH